MSSPGSGKTTTLRRTAELLKDEMNIGVMEADIDSDVDGRPPVVIGEHALLHLNDANRVHAASSPFGRTAWQIPCESLLWFWSYHSSGEKFIIQDLGKEEIRSILEVRRALEHLAAERAILYTSDQALDLLRGLAKGFTVMGTPPIVN